MPQLLDSGLFSINDTDGSIGVGWKLNFYTTGTSARRDTFPTLADAIAGTNPNANPVIVPSDGRVPAIWLLDGDYKCVLTNASDVVKKTTDPVADTPGPGNAATRTELAAITPFAGRTAFLRESGREGWFYCVSGSPPADVLQGIYVDSNTANFYWERVWDGVNARPEWFGAVKDDLSAAAANTAAIQACIDLSSTTMLSGHYYTHDSLVIDRNGTRIYGSGVTQTDQGANTSASVITCTSASASIIRMGSTSATQPALKLETCELKDFIVNRSTGPTTPASGIATGAIGIELRWTVNARIERVFSINSAKGFSFFGTVQTDVEMCRALRALEGTDAAGDYFIGYYADYAAPLAANGGNASLYLTKCRAYPFIEDGAGGTTGPSLTYSAGVRTDDGFVDLFIDGHECAGMQYGIHCVGDVYDSSQTFKTQDLIISNGVLDGCTVFGIVVQTGNSATAVQIFGNYIATSGTAVGLFSLNGSVGVFGNQFIGGDCVGVSASDANGIDLYGNIYTKIVRPVTFDTVGNFRIEETIHVIDTGFTHPGIELIDCVRGYINTGMNGPTNSLASGVHFNGAGNSKIEINVSRIQLDMVNSIKINNNGVTIAATGAFGTNCLASGIMA